MQQKTLGQIIRESRQRQKLSKSKLAKKIKISTSYVNHLECNSAVYLSEPLLKRLRVALKIRNSNIERLAKKQNKRAYEYYSNYRKKNAA